MLSRGQAWAEYIVILAVVIIMAGIAMYLAGGFAGGNEQISERDSAAYWVSADVGIIRYVANSSMLQLVIKNNKNFRIRVSSITSKGSGTLSSAVTLEPGQTAQVNVTGVGCSPGVYSFPLVIKYTDTRYGTEYSFTGEKPLVSHCMDSSAIQPPPECSSNSECGYNSTPCQPYCNGNTAYSYPSNPATCQRTCSNGRCNDCSPSCGTPTPTNCSKSGYCSSGSCIPCESGYGNCNENPSDFCEVNLLEDDSNCGSCGNLCAGNQLCCSGVCETPECSSNAECDDTNSCTTDFCNNPNTCNAQCTHTPITPCCGNSICEAGESYSTCPQDCCNSDCTGEDGKCHTECSPYCTGWLTVCNNQNKGTKLCSDLTHNVTCCNSISVCPNGGTCQNGNCVAPYCGDGICNGGETQTTCCQDCGCPANRYCCDCGAGCTCRTSNQCRFCDYC
ncbi:MAG: hypothetical protein QXF56_03640 [Candidatus Micrarchaeia archaeon]